MTEPHTLDVQRLLAEEPFVRRLARTLARDDADDVAQQTFLQALRARGPLATTPRRWLAAVLRNVHRDRKRAESRRRALEGEAPAPGTVPSSHELLEREERRRALVLAVDALPAPLRARLDAAHGDRRAWLLPLLAPLRRVAGAAALPGLLATGALFLKAKTAVALLAGAAAFGLAFWALGPGPAAPSGPPAGTGPGTPAPVQADLGEQAPPRGPAGEHTLQRTRPESSPTAADPDQAVLHGRCVDESGAPLDGVTVGLRGEAASPSRMDAYLRDHDGVAWEDPERLVTGPDGRFDFRFVPPPPFSFSLRVTSPGKATLSGRWSRIAPGAVKDLGDVVVPPGVEVTGRVVDEDGEPRTGIHILLDREPRPGSEPTPLETGSARTEDGGTFRLRDLLLPGTWKLRVPGAALAEPRQRVELEPPATDLQVVVRRPPQTLVLAGRVVDGHGRPIGGARVRPTIHSGNTSGGHTDEEGRFLVEGYAEDASQGSFFVQVEKEGHELRSRGTRYDWGTDDARLVLRRLLDLVVRVRRARDGRPVEGFGLRVFPMFRSSNRDNEVHGGWHHEGGRVRVQDLHRGTYRILVEPRPESGLARAGPVEVEVGAGMPGTIEVLLPDRSTRRVRVVRRDGTPVPDSEVELLDPFDEEPVGAGTRALPPSSWHPLKQSCLLLYEATTDARGTCLLRGDPDREHVVRVSGDHHVTTVRPGVRIDGEPLEIVVATGATLHVTLEPIEVLREMREQAGLPPTGEVHEHQQYLLPRIRLVREQGNAKETFPRDVPSNALACDEDGVARLRGVPAGTWSIQLLSSVRLESAVPFGPDAHVSAAMVRTGIVLEEGEERRLTLDVSRHRRGRLRGLLTVNGRPHEGRVQLTSGLGHRQGPDSSAPPDFLTVPTDAGGRFEVLLRPGTWHATTWIGGDLEHRTRAPGSAHVVPGETTEARFDVPAGHVTLRLRLPDGGPAAGVPMHFVDDGEFFGKCTTDDAGIVKLTIPPGTLRPRARIRSLADSRAAQEYRQKHHGDPEALARAFVELGPIRFVAGEDREVERRLPPAWDR